MCTLIIAHRVWPGVPLLVAANRDEVLDRPAVPPRIVLSGGMRVLAPLDLAAGGTWLGLSSARVFAGITNRFGCRPDAGRRSRGELAFTALEEGTALDAARRVERLDAASYNGFHMAMADQANAAVVWGDGVRMHRVDLRPGIHFLTERSFGAARSGREDYLRGALPMVEAAHEPDLGGLAGLLSYHAKDPFDSLCVHLDTPRYGTRSSAVVRLGDAVDDVRFLFADGPPCRTAPQDLSGLAASLGPGSGEHGA